jgi:hypothetical protein
LRYAPVICAIWLDTLARWDAEVVSWERVGCCEVRPRDGLHEGGATQIESPIAGGIASHKLAVAGDIIGMSRGQGQKSQ